MLHEGELVLYLEKGGRSLLTFAPFDADAVATSAVEALGSLLRDGRVRRLQVEKVDGTPVAEFGQRDRLGELGFRSSYKGLVLAPDAAGSAR